VIPATLHMLFERLLGNAAPPTGDVQARQLAELSARLESDDGELAETALLAAYLDDGLDAASQLDLHLRMARSASALHDIASADAFIEAVTVGLKTAPADLVAASLARSQPARAVRRSFRLWTWSGVVAALAAAAIVGFFGLDRQAPPLPAPLPVVATLPPAPAPIPPPVVATAPPHPAMVPAGAEAKMPPAKDCKTKKVINGKLCGKPHKPAMAPERLDAVPGR